MSLLTGLRRAIGSSPLVEKAEDAVRSGEKAAAQIEHDVAHEVEGWAKGAEHEVVDLVEDAFDVVRQARVTGKFQSVPHAQLKLKADSQYADQVSRIEQSGGFEKVSLGDLPLNRSYTTGSDRGPDATLPSTEMRHQTPEGFTFDAEDSKTAEWMPQGITTSADANPDTGEVDGKRWVAVTWHHDDGKRSRISFVDTTHPNDPAQRRYRNVELMVPDPKGSGKLLPLRSHVGGVSWVGNHLYVAQTGGGIRVFDVRDLLKVDDPSKVPAGTEPYVLPQIGYYKTQAPTGVKAHAGEGAAPIFSGLSVDRSQAQPALLSQEYDADHPGGRIIRWPIDPTTGQLQTDGDGTVHATDAWSVPLKRLAGVARTKEGFEVATMGSPSGLWELHPGDRPRLKDSLAKGIQQFSYDPAQNRIWTVAEHPGHRMVWAFTA